MPVLGKLAFQDHVEGGGVVGVVRLEHYRETFPVGGTGRHLEIMTNTTFCDMAILNLRVVTQDLIMM